MRKFMLHGAIAIVWSTIAVSAGCGLFSEDVRSTIVGVGVDAAVTAAREIIGNAADTSPTMCEVENNAGDAQLLVLCTVCYGQDTSACIGKSN